MLNRVTDGCQLLSHAVVSLYLYLAKGLLLIHTSAGLR